MRSVFRTLKSLVTRAGFECEMREEMAAHVEHRADDLVASGMSRRDALRRARLEFGAVEAYKEQCRDAVGFAPARVLHGFGADLKLAARRLAATPLFTIFAVLSLGLGVGITTAVYSVVDRIFWKELGITNLGQVVLVLGTEAGPYDPRFVVSERDFADLRAAQTSFAAISASQAIYPAVATETATEIQAGEAVDGAYFSMLGVSPSLGRLILPADDTSAAAVVVLSDALWRTRFNADPAVVGRTIRLSSRPFEIVGVAPPSFEGPVPGPRGTRLWVPLAVKEWFPLGSGATTVPDRERRRLTVIGRLAPGRTVQSATTELTAIATALDAEYPRTRAMRPGVKAERGWRAKIVTELGERDELFSRLGLLIFVLIALVLVVACTNLANLVLARGTMRQQEFAVRRALGASRWRLVREQSAESMILAAAGGVAAWILIKGLVRVFDFEVPFGPAWMTVSVQPETDAAALAASAGALILSLLVFGLEPALQLTMRSDVRAELAGGAQAVGVPKARRQRILLRWQVAISAGFFIIATLCVRYLASEARHDSGVDLDRIAIASVDFHLQRIDEQRARDTARRILDSLRQEPGIQAAAVSSGLPFGSSMMPWLAMSTTDKTLGSDDTSEGATLIVATPDIFRAAGISILSGRGFDDRDDAGAPPAVVLAASCAKRMFGTMDAVGRQLLVRVETRAPGAEQPVRTANVVGVAEDTDSSRFFGARRGNTVYMPFAQAYSPWITVVARAESPSIAVRALRSAIQGTAPDLGVQFVAAGRTSLAGPFVFLRSAGIVAVCLGAVTLLLAMVGLYGVQSHIVAHRTREIGVRMSLGATAEEIRRMVLRDGYRPVLQGLAIGLFIGIAGRAIVRSYLTVKVDVIDPWMLILVPLPLLLAAFFACLLPAYRASRVDPNVALRNL